MENICIWRLPSILKQAYEKTKKRSRKLALNSNLWAVVHRNYKVTSETVNENNGCVLRKKGTETH